MNKSLIFMKICKITSPNSSKIRRKINEIRYLIIHYTGMQSKRASIKRLIDKKQKVSCHYLIDRSGGVTQMVDESLIAWHAGKSKWKNLKNLNKNSIGIELVNKGHHLRYEKFTNKQINQLIKLCLILKKKYKIKKDCVLGHSDIAPLRKKDPGEKFPWQKLSKKGLCFSYFTGNKNNTINYSEKKIRNLFFNNLHKIGYRYFSKSRQSKKEKLVIKAFQRRFIQSKIDGKIDQKTLKISHYLASKT